jgi:hypothetical protein
MATQVESRPRNASDILGTASQARGVGASQGTVVEQSRAIAEVQGALTVAHARPRDKSRALNEALESCRTREVAEGAFFKFSRGGGSVAGLTVHIARELARCWGNIMHDVIELERNDEAGYSEMLARAWDLETNTQSRTQFIVPHLRDKKGGASRLTDVRDIYENNANMGARRLRECILNVLPPYLVKAAEEECRNTLERGEGEEPIAVRTAKLLTAFAAIGIDKARIEAKLGSVSRFTTVDLANMRIAYQSIKRGEILADDEFPRGEGAAPVTSKLDALEAAITPNEDHQEKRGDEDMGERFNGTDPDEDEHPATAKARNIAAEIDAAKKLDVVGAIEQQYAADIKAMSDADKAIVYAAIDAWKTRGGAK